MQPKTISQIFNLKPTSYAEMRSNKNKWWREGFVAAKFCEYFKWTNALIYFPQFDIGDDVLIKHQNNNYPFQITELAPSNPRVKEQFPQAIRIDDITISDPYNSICTETTETIIALIDIKQKKHYADQNSINLLIYINPPNIYVDSNDINLKILRQYTQTIQFKTISLLVNDEIIFIKSDISDLFISQ